MIGALATTLLFAANAIFANRSAQRLGSNRANLARLTIAVLILGTWAHLAGGGLRGSSLGWFLLSGVAGFGVGGVAMFQALPRLGSPLAMLIVQCGSAVVAAAVEFGWLGTRLSPTQLAWVAVTLLGVALGLLPRSLPAVPSGVLRAGIAWAFLSAAGQGVGAVLSRKAFRVAAAMQEHPDAATTAYQRALAGLGVAALVVAGTYVYRRYRDSGVGEVPLGVHRRTGPASGVSDAADHGRAWPWVFANALCGPVLGVTCFQWALSTTPAGIVQPIVATAPLITIPLARWLEHARPRPLYYVGAVLAVAGVAGLFVYR
jgi:drug/metabolite transporter (DMT)-like permease